MRSEVVCGVCGGKSKKHLKEKRKKSRQEIKKKEEDTRLSEIFKLSDFHQLRMALMRRSASVAALRMLLLATPLHASLIAPSVQLRGAPAHSAAATRCGIALHACYRS